MTTTPLPTLGSPAPKVPPSRRSTDGETAQLAPGSRSESSRLMRFPLRATVVSTLVSLVPLALLGVMLLTDVLDPSGGAAAGVKTAAQHTVPMYFRVFVSMALIGAFAHAGGWLAVRLGQPKVVGEIVAGLILGPSVLGRFLPEVATAIFPADVKPLLALLAQVGLVLFMFAVGFELDTSIMRRQGGVISMLSQATMIAPFALGIMIVPFLYPAFAGAGVGFTAFALFMGTAISITAFPVLARIVHDTGLSKTRLGSLAMVCAGMNDVLAWCALAAVMAILQAGSPLEALWSIPLTVGAVALIFLVVKPLLARLAERFADHRISLAVTLAGVLALVFALAALTEKIGVHAIFGAFLAGMILPRESKLLGDVPDRIHGLNRILILPVFFASVGMSVDIFSAIGKPEVLLGGALIMVVAVGGKLVSAAICARAGGMPWRESLGLGVLLNARGITEIVVLQAGLSVGVINRDAFTIMIFMALVTTVMTVPLLRALKLARRTKAGAIEALTPERSLVP